MRFIHLLHRDHASLNDKTQQRLLLVMVVLGTFLLLQVGLVLWVYLKQWR